MSLVQRTDYVPQAEARLPRVFRDKPRLFALLAAFAEGAQDFEAHAFGMYAPRFLANAVGATLDLYGAIVGQARLGMDDASYRLRIRARMALNRSSGTVPDIIRIAQLLVPNNTVLLREAYPAALLMQIEGGATPLSEDVYQILYSAKAAGVSFRLTTQGGADAQRFVFSGGVGLGFGGYATNYVGDVLGLVPVVEVPASVGPVTQTAVGGSPLSLGPMQELANQNGSAAPVAAITSAVDVPTGLGTVTLTVISSGGGTFAWSAGGGYGNSSGQDMVDDEPVVLVDENVTLSDIGLSVTWGGGEPYNSPDSWSFTVTDDTSSTGAPPSVSLTPPVDVGIGTITLSFISGMDFDWSNGTTGGQHNLLDGGSLGAPIELVDGNTGMGTGVFVTFGAGESYVSGDAFTFTVTDAVFATSTAPVVAVSGTVTAAAQGQWLFRVTAGAPDYTFEYQRPDGSWRNAASMNRGSPVILRDGGLQPVGLTVTWPNVSTYYVNAQHTVRVHRGVAVTGGHWTDVR